ncbi:hypothetical protein [Pantoea sp. GD03673]|uniref:hypothetical protein n=1 Tax=Pantoea sp. GD03673 TaxID=2975364 RepID=UPI002447E8CA|nr:hypothetical protein [Pantoea sp. GD03673]MDH2068934.1 hypothetical protein [Pantoea sp. GD03673]
MKELKTNEIEMVSGAGLTAFLAGLNTAISQVNTELVATSAALENSTSNGKTIFLSYKQFGLSAVSYLMTGISSFLSVFAK